MRKFTLLLTAFFAVASFAKAQTVATFDDLSLTGSDTFYINYSMPGMDVGFSNGQAYFPCYYDTAWGGLWNGGFAYSNMTDSVTSGAGNKYSAKAGAGYGSSSKYAVCWCSDPATYAPISKIILSDSAQGKNVTGFYVTNSTYAYNSMRDGDAFAKKFGGATGTDADWYMLTIKGYRSGSITTDSINFYLADYRFSSSDSDYIVKDWTWVNLNSLGHVDSLQLSLSSSDVGSFGMNTPAYFCIDNFTTNETSAGIATANTIAAKIYPIPANNTINVELNDATLEHYNIIDMSGKVVLSGMLTKGNTAIAIETLQAGNYQLQMFGNGKFAQAKFSKQ